MTGTNNPVNLSTRESVSQEDQHKQEECTKRKADESNSESESSEEEEEESPVSLDSDDEEYQGSETPSDPGCPRIKSTGPLSSRHPRRSPLAPNARQPGSQSKVAAVKRIKGEEVRSA